jgi:hypothetical protein
MADTRTSRSQALLQMAAFALGGMLGLCAGASRRILSRARARRWRRRPVRLVTSSQIRSTPLSPTSATARALRQTRFVTSSTRRIATSAMPAPLPNPQLTDRQIEEIGAYLATLHTK